MTQPVPDFTQGYSAFQVGGDYQPISTSSVNTLLQDSDSALYYSLDFWSWVIRTYQGPRLLQASAQCMGANAFTDAVASRYPWAPDLENEANQFKFPLLAMYRKDSSYKQKTASWEHDRTEFDMVYVLPPLTAGQVEQILPILRSVELSVRQKTTYGHDPNYIPPGGTLGALPWQLSGVEEIGFLRGHYGTWKTGGNMRFPFLHMEGYFLERDMPVAAPLLSGFDVGVSVSGSDGTTIPFAQVATQQAPTITTVFPATGPIAGGSLVTFTGTNFLNGPPVVMFGTQRAWSVAYVSATQITAVSPAYQDPGNITITVVNRDGQSATAPFTYV